MSHLAHVFRASVSVSVSVCVVIVLLMSLPLRTVPRVNAAPASEPTATVTPTRTPYVCPSPYMGTDTYGECFTDLTALATFLEGVLQLPQGAVDPSAAVSATTGLPLTYVDFFRVVGHVQLTYVFGAPIDRFPACPVSGPPFVRVIEGFDTNGNPSSVPGATCPYAQTVLLGGHTPVIVSTNEGQQIADTIVRKLQEGSPTATSGPPTATSGPPTATPGPPTAAPVPPTATPVPLTATRAPTDTPTPLIW